MSEINALVIVAHPDDETIWMGGTILMHPDWNWTILSLCRKGDQDREPKFFRVCEQLGENVKGIISNLDDDILDDLEIEEVVEKILEVVPNINYDMIYTHGANGEYGHKRHKEIHKAVRKLVVKKELNCNELKFFSYEQGNVYVENNTELNLMVPRENAATQERIELSKEILKRKAELVKHVYGFDETTFEVVTTRNLKEEAFEVYERME